MSKGQDVVAKFCDKLVKDQTCQGEVRQGWASVLFKRTERFLHSFPFFKKEQNDLCVLFHSL